MEIQGRNKIFSGRVFDVEQVQVKLPNEKSHTYDLVNHHDSVTILPIDEDNQIWFVRQFRVGSQSDLLELPAGVVEKHEAPRACAAREIREEIGMASRYMKKIGSFYLAPGYCTEMNHVFLARQLHPSALSSDEDEFLEVVCIPKERAYQMARDGKIKDGKSVAALFLGQPWLKS